MKYILPVRMGCRKFDRQRRVMGGVQCGLGRGAVETRTFYALWLLSRIMGHTAMKGTAMPTRDIGLRRLVRAGM